MWKNWKGKQVLQTAIRSQEQAIKKALQEVGRHADQEVPHDEGMLQQSKHIDTQISGTKVEGVISYGGGQGTGFVRVPYAIRWHENNANFQKGRKKNYLRDPFNKYARKEFEKHIKNTFK